MNDDFFRCFFIACSFFKIPLFPLLFRVLGGGGGGERRRAAVLCCFPSPPSFSRERERWEKLFFIFDVPLPHNNNKNALPPFSFNKSR